MSFYIYDMLWSIASLFWVLKFPHLWPREVLHIDFMLSFWYDPFALISYLLSGTRYHRLTMNFLPWLEETLPVYILVPFFPNSCSFLKGRNGRNRERWVQRRREWQWQIANTVGDSLLFLGLCLLVDEITLLQGPCLYASLWLCLWHLLSLCPLSIFVPSQVLSMWQAVQVGWKVAHSSYLCSTRYRFGEQSHGPSAYGWSVRGLASALQAKPYSSVTSESESQSLCLQWTWGSPTLF